MSQGEEGEVPMTAKNESIIDSSKLGVTSILQKTGEDAVLDHQPANRDEEVLVALGYRQEFKRDLSIWSSFSVSFSVLGLLPSVASTLSYDLGFSGPAGMVWGWIVAGILVQFVAFSMAELCSSMPTAGGLYYASAALAPEGWGPLFAWITGWSNFCGLVSGPASVNFALALMIITAAEIGNPTYAPENWHVYLIFLLLLAIEGALTVQSTKFIGRLNKVGTVINLVVVFIFIVWFPAGSINHPKTNNSHYVWTQIINGTEWPTGLAFIMGFLTVVWTLAGYDAPFHLSEECSNANIASPRAIVMTAQLGLYLGFAIILVIAYTVKDITDVVAGSYGQPMGSLCLQVLGQRAGLAMFALNIVAQFFVGEGLVITSSRVVYAYSRDGALPGSRWLKQVNPRTETPVNAVIFVLAIATCLGALLFAGPAAIGAVFSIGAIAQYMAFIIPIALKFFAVRDKFRPGPWNLGHFSKPVNAVAIAFVALIVPILCFPAVKGHDLTLISMNWTCLLYGGTMSLALSWYAIDARKWFKGPKVNVKHVIHNQPNVEKDERKL